MRKRGPVWAWIGAGFLMMGSLMLDLRPVLNNATPGLQQQDQEDWSVVSKGDLNPFAYQLISNNYQHPLGLHFKQDRPLYYTGAWLYFNSRTVITPSKFSGALDSKPPDTYAKIESPSGSSVWTTIDSCENNSSVYAVQIPAAYAPGTAYLKVTIFAKGLRSTTVRLDRLPSTTETLPQTADLLEILERDGVKAKGEAFLVSSKQTGESAGLGYRVHWTGLDSKLLWRTAMPEILAPFIPLSRGSGPPRGLIYSDMSQGKQEAENMRVVPFPDDVQMIRAEGRIEGYEVVTDTVDFGTIPLTKEEYTVVTPKGSQIQESTETSYYLKLGESFTRTLKSGLRLTLLPLVSRKERNIFYSWPTICLRLKVEPDSIRAATTKFSPSSQKTIVEVKLLDYQTTFNRIEPDPNPRSKVSNFFAVNTKGMDPRSVHLSFEVRIMRLKQQIAYDFRLPVDRSISVTAPWSYPAMSFINGN